MSLILDALKRAEQERKLGQPQEAVQMATSAPLAGPERSADRTLVVVLAILLLAAAIVIAALLLRPHAPPQPAQPAALPTVPAEAMRPIPQAAGATPHPAPEPAPAVITDHEKVSNLDDVVAADDGKAENAQAARVAEGNLPDANADNAIHRPTGNGTRSSGGPRIIVPGNASSSRAARNDAATDAQDQDEPPPQPSALSLRDMPENFREAFPQFSIDVHVYNDDPEHRFIIVGGNTYHEGTTLPQGPHIDAITADGVVFEWQGQRVLYGLGSN